MSQGGLLIKTFTRVTTGIPGLDTILGGGLLRGGIYLIMGTPGTGKTIIANQFGFHHVGKGGRALYVSLLSESHSRLFGHLKPMGFFREERISESFNFVSAYHVLEKEGLDGLLKTLAQTVRQYRADLLFIDGVASAEDLARSNVSFKKFVHDLNTVLSTSGCTAVLLSSLQGNLTHPEHTMVDGIISLSMKERGMNATREIAVTKLRGSAQLTGRHFFRISADGITVYPRAESFLGQEYRRAEDSNEQVSLGDAQLDALLDGGLLKGSVTAVVGAAGTGKTLFGTKFLSAGAALGEKGYYFGFYENPYRLRRRAEQLSAYLGDEKAEGKILVEWFPPYELMIDEIIHRILRAIDERGVKRFYFDGITGLRDSMAEKDRLASAFTALTIELRNRGVTTVFTEETELFATVEHTPMSDHSAITDNIVHLRYLGVEGEFKRQIAVQKIRERRPDQGLREFTISEKGISVRGLLPVAEASSKGTRLPRGRAGAKQISKPPARKRTGRKK
jgi:circadian clock protein KaiC